MSEYSYVEIVQGNITKRSNIVKIPKSNIHLDYYGKDVTNAFHSVYMFPIGIKDHVDQTDSVRNYTGPVWANAIHWDFDCDDLKQAQLDTIELCDRLLTYNKDNLFIYFSGNKGFHVYFIHDRFNTDMEVNDQVRKIAHYFASDLSTFDVRIYDKTRIIRTPNSKHPKTGLYKIPLSYKELQELTISEILEYATVQCNALKPIVIVTDHEFYDKVQEIYQLNQIISTPKNYSGYGIIERIENGFEAGERNTGMASVAGMLHSRNIDNNFITSILNIINEKNNPPLPGTEIKAIVNSISRYPVNDQYLPAAEGDIVTMKQAAETWKHLIQNSGQCSFGDRFGHLNERMKICIPGDVVAIVANSGNGKTSIGMELGNNEARNKDGYSLFISLEMSKAGVYFRAATIESDHIDDNNYVKSDMVVKTLLKDKDFNKQVQDEWKHLLIMDKAGIGLEKVEEYFILAQEITKNRVTNVIIDYAQNLDKAEDISFAMKMARQLKELAKKLNTILFVLMQCNKTMPNSYTEVEKNHIEGAGAYFQACDYIIGFWRSTDENNRLHGKFVKERWGDSELKFDFVRDGLKYHTEDFLPDRQSRDVF